MKEKLRPGKSRVVWAGLTALVLSSYFVSMGIPQVKAQRPLAGAAATPVYSNLAVTSVGAGTISVFATKWSDTSGLSQYVFSFDPGSGTLVNDTAVSFSGTTNWSNTTKTLSASVGMKVQWRVYAKDVNNNWNSTNVMCAVIGTNGVLSSSTYALVTDDCFDLLAYDGANLYNLGNLPQLVKTSTSFVGYHGVQWDAVQDTALIVGYNNAMVKYAGGKLSVLNTGLPSSVGLNDISWRPGSNTFALITGDNGNLLSYNNGVFSTISSGTTQSLKKVAWKPDGTYALIAGNSGLILKYDYPGGMITTIPSGTTQSLQGVDFKPDGTGAIFAGTGGLVLVYSDVGGGVSVLTGVGNSYQFQTVKFSRNGAYALLTSQNNARGNLVMWSVTGGGFSNVTSGTSNTANQVSFAPDDSYAYVTLTSGALLKQAYGATTATVIALTHDRLRGIDFFGVSSSGTTTTTTTSSTTSASSSTISSTSSTASTTSITTSMTATSTTSMTATSTTSTTTTSTTTSSSSTSSQATASTTSTSVLATSTLSSSTRSSSSSTTGSITSTKTTSVLTTITRRSSATITSSELSSFATSSTFLQNSSSSGGRAGGIPEYPISLPFAAAFTFVLVVFYGLFRRRILRH